MTTSDDIKKRVPDWARNVVCPVCQGIMTPIHSKPEKSNRWGESITYQCHNGKCFTVTTVTTSVPYYMRAGDFDVSEFDWRELAPQCVAVTRGVTGAETPRGIGRVPDCPWVRSTATKVIWDAFWDGFKAGSPRHARSVSDVAAAVVRLKGDNPRVRALLKDFPKWMSKESGLKIVQIGTEYVAIG